jgi:hypothetical protein
VPITINEIEVFINFHIFAILEFDLLIGYLLDKIFQEKYPHRSFSEKFGKTTSATHLEIPMVEHIPNEYPFEEVKFISPFISHRFPCETECPPSPLLKLKQCPSGRQNVVLDNGRDSMLILQDLSLEIVNSYAMDILLNGMCSYEHSNHLLILISKLFRRIVVDAYVYQKYCRSRSCIVVLALQLEH